METISIFLTLYSASILIYYVYDFFQHNVFCWYRMRFIHRCAPRRRYRPSDISLFVTAVLWFVAVFLGLAG